MITVTTDEVTVGVVWAEALNAKVTDAQIIRALLIISAKEISRMLVLVSYLAAFLGGVSIHQLP